MLFKKGLLTRYLLVVIITDTGTCEAPLKTGLVSSNLPHRAESGLLSSSQRSASGRLAALGASFTIEWVILRVDRQAANRPPSRGGVSILIVLSGFINYSYNRGASSARLAAS